MAGSVGGVSKCVRDPSGNAAHSGFLHPARGAGGRADADAAQPQRGFGIVGNHLFVGGDSGAVE